MKNKYLIKRGGCTICSKGCGKQDNQLHTFDWLSGVPGNEDTTGYVEVQFKNTRKGYYKNSNAIPIEKGDIVAVESNPGHDIGTVTLTGRLVLLQMKKAKLKDLSEIKRIYRKVKPVDMEKYAEAKAREHETMIRSRQIANNLGLKMKIGDVEFQGDGNKAIFYYIADERVDFRQLIKVLAEEFRVRIEMKQIGARQEAGRIGGIGPCGRELCCATWLSNFTSVSTTAARLQEISLKPTRLAGQCAKLKCCMNYEVDVYAESQKRFPSREIALETKDNTYYWFKADILKGTITYSTDKRFLANEATITPQHAFKVLQMNKRGERPEQLVVVGEEIVQEAPKDLLEQESLTRFDQQPSKKNKKRKPQRNTGERRPEKAQEQDTSKTHSGSRSERPRHHQKRRREGGEKTENTSPRNVSE
ncbi:MAG: regulatory iron-sulfur-containing complex subunit RicT [Phocaeicola sp.]|nr:hypothetical protein [Phocaeicola sp.]MDD7448945.1 regulatory iron-sulfur-containing complex subunit RicT [Prevotellaceae bacterium]MDY5939710.1 regulatory iron-sulfur-containing complex subunit RicT [Phocaeicola sp.]